MKTLIARLSVLSVSLLSSVETRSGNPGCTACNWCRPDVNAIQFQTYSINPADLQAEWIAEINNAGQKWSAAPCEFRLNYVGEDSAYTFTTGDGVSTFSRVALDSAIVGRTVTQVRNNEILEADTALSANKTFCVHPGGGGCYSVRAVSMHEFGHWLTVGHLGGPQDVMNPANVQIGDHMLDLGPGDVSGCQMIYPVGKPWRSPPCSEGACCNTENATCTVATRGTCQDPKQFSLYQTCDEVECEASPPPPPPPPECCGGGGGGPDPSPPPIDDEFGPGQNPIDNSIGAAELQICPDRKGQEQGWSQAASDAEDLEYRPTCAGCGDGLGLAMRRVLRSMMKLTPVGRQQLTLWNTHRTEVVTIFSSHPEVGALVSSRVNDFMPGLRSYLYNDLGGANFTLDATKIAQVEEVVNAIKQHGSATLQADLDAFMVLVRLEQGKSVKAGLAHFIGLTL